MAMTPASDPSSSDSRRAFLRRSAVVGAAVWAVPAAQVVSLTGLTAASASGPAGGPGQPVVRADLPGIGNQGSTTVTVPGSGQETVVVNPGQKDTGVIINPGQGQGQGQGQGGLGATVDPGNGKATLITPGGGAPGRQRG